MHYHDQLRSARERIIAAEVRKLEQRAARSGGGQRRIARDELRGGAQRTLSR